MAYSMPVYVREERLSAREFLQLMRETPDAVATTRFEPPAPARWGKEPGHYRVTYKTAQKRDIKLPSFDERLAEMSGGYPAYDY